MAKQKLLNSLDFFFHHTLAFGICPTLISVFILIPAMILENVKVFFLIMLNIGMHDVSALTSVSADISNFLIYRYWHCK